MLYALIDGQNRDVSCAGEPSVIEQRLQRTKYLRRTIGLRINSIDKVRAGQVKLALRNRLCRVIEKRAGFSSQEFFDAIDGRERAFHLSGHDIRPPKLRRASSLRGTARLQRNLVKTRLGL